MNRLFSLGKISFTGKFPKKNQEDWKYINLQPHLKENYVLDLEEGLVEKKDIKKISLQNLDSYQIELLNGKLLSKPTIPGVEIYTLEEAKKKHPEIILENLQKTSNHSLEINQLCQIQKARHLQYEGKSR